MLLSKLLAYPKISSQTFMWDVKSAVSLHVYSRDSDRRKL